MLFVISCVMLYDVFAYVCVIVCAPLQNVLVWFVCDVLCVVVGLFCVFVVSVCVCLNVIVYRVCDLLCDVVWYGFC